MGTPAGRGAGGSLPRARCGPATPLPGLVTSSQMALRDPGPGGLPGEPRHACKRLTLGLPGKVRFQPRPAAPPPEKGDTRCARPPAGLIVHLPGTHVLSPGRGGQPQREGCGCHQHAVTGDFASTLPASVYRPELSEATDLEGPPTLPCSALPVTGVHSGRDKNPVPTGTLCGCSEEKRPLLGAHTGAKGRPRGRLRAGSLTAG